MDEVSTATNLKDLPTSTITSNATATTVTPGSKYDDVKLLQVLNDKSDTALLSDFETQKLTKQDMTHVVMVQHLDMTSPLSAVA